MSCEIVAKALSFLGGVITLLPSVHVGWREWEAYRLEPRRSSGPALAEAWRRAAKSFRERLQDNGATYFAISVLGLVVLTVGFGVDLGCEISKTACNSGGAARV